MDSIEVEFKHNCVKTYSWNFRIYQPWEVINENGTTVLYFDGRYFSVKETSKSGFVFTNLKKDSIEFELFQVTKNRINSDQILGIWIEDRYQHWAEDDFIPPPPCPFLSIDTFYIPSIKFNHDSCITTTVCEKEKTPIRINEHFGIIEIGGYCTTPNQWKIKHISKDTMVVAIRYLENSEIKYVGNRKFIKQ